jgi:putative DNA primase/helicase
MMPNPFAIPIPPPGTPVDPTEQEWMESLPPELEEDLQKRANLGNGVPVGIAVPRASSPDQQRAEELQHDTLQGHGEKHEPRADITDAELNDVGNARRLAKEHGEFLTHCHPLKRWFVWDNVRWYQDDTGGIQRFAKDTVLDLYSWTETEIAAIREQVKLDEEIGGCNSDELNLRLGRIRKALKWAGQSLAAPRINAMIDLARSEPGIPILPEQFDADPWLLNCQNGVLELKTGVLREHRRNDFMSKLCPVEYDADATCPLWMQCLDRWMAGDEELIRYLQRSIGYALSGDVSEQCLWFLHGEGNNGKSVFLKIVLMMLGDYGMQSPSDLLLAKEHESHPTAIADLWGRRFVSTIEVDDGKRLAEALLKQLTGSDKIRARFLYRDYFEFWPSHKIFLAANHKPQVRGTDLGIWRRIKLIPWSVVIPPAERDGHLDKKLSAELPGILAWAVRGCLDWQEKGGLQEPDAVRQAIEVYRSEEDSLGRFIAECCWANREAKVAAGALFDSYSKWSGDKFMTPQGLGKKLKEKGYSQSRGHNGVRFWEGIGLIEGSGDAW